MRDSGRKKTNVSQFDFVERPVFVVNWHAFHGVQCRICTIYHFAHDGVFAVEMGLLRVCDEELGLVGIWARISHRHDAAGVKLGTKEDQDGRRMDEKVEREPTLRVDLISSANGAPQML